MCNKVGEETCRFREVLGGLVWDGEHELEPIFILDGLDENGALFIASSESWEARNALAHRLLVLGPGVTRDHGSPDKPTVGD